jgi:hypothetical protein
MVDGPVGPSLPRKEPLGDLRDPAPAKLLRQIVDRELCRRPESILELAESGLIARHSLLAVICSLAQALRPLAAVDDLRFEAPMLVSQRDIGGLEICDPTTCHRSNLRRGPDGQHRAMAGRSVSWPTDKICRGRKPYPDDHGPLLVGRETEGCRARHEFG